MSPALQPLDEPPVEGSVSRGHAGILGSRTLRWPDEDACAATARSLAERAALRNAFIELHGPLGAGKTTFVRHLLRSLGVEGRVKSPTYTLAELYDVAGLAIAHCDFYRFEDPHEWEDAGLRDIFAERGLKLAEWPERADPLLPVPDLRLRITPLDDGVREVLLEALSTAGVELLR